MLEKSIKNLMEIVNLSADEIKNNNKDITAILDFEDLKSLKEVLDYMKQQDMDLTTVYLSGVYDGKQQATIDNSICKEKLAEDALQENVKLKKKLDEIIHIYDTSKSELANLPNGERVSLSDIAPLVEYLKEVLGEEKNENI